MSDITFLNASGTSQSAGAIATAGGLLTPYYTQERFVSVATPQTGAGLGVSLSTPYAAGDAIGTKIEFPNVRKPDGSVVVLRQLQVYLNESGIGSNSIEAWLFNADPAAPVDNSAYLPAYASGMIGCIGKVTLTGAVGTGATLHTWTGTLYAAPSATSVFAVLVATGAFTLTTASERRASLYGDHG